MGVNMWILNIRIKERTRPAFARGFGEAKGVSNRI